MTKKIEPVTAQDNPALTPFRLTKEHEHGGKMRQPGKVILLRNDQVERLAKEGKGEVTTFAALNNGEHSANAI